MCLKLRIYKPNHITYVTPYVPFLHVGFQNSCKKVNNAKKSKNAKKKEMQKKRKKLLLWVT